MVSEKFDDGIEILVAGAGHEKYVDEILDTISAAAKVRGTGIAKRTHEYVAQKMKEGKAIIALAGDEFAGFCYIESWGNRQYVANSGLIVKDKFRGHGLARRIKKRAFELSREKWPNAKLFGLTSGGAVMNTELRSRSREGHGTNQHCQSQQHGQQFCYVSHFVHPFIFYNKKP